MKTTKKQVFRYFCFFTSLFSCLVIYNHLNKAIIKNNIEKQFVYLDKLLLDKNYIQADIKTASLLGDIIKYEISEESFLAYELDFFGDVRIKKIRSGITCESLKRINNSWNSYSNEKFGFKSQLEELRKESIHLDKSSLINGGHIKLDKYWKWDKYIDHNKNGWYWTIEKIPEETPKGFLPSNLWMLANSPKPMRDISSNLEKYETCNRK